MRRALAAAALVAAGPAGAASFDCAKAESAAERAICADPALGRADEAMAAAFRKALAKLSPNGQALLRDNQRAFLRVYEAECAPGGTVNGWEKRRSLAACLTASFTERAGGLTRAVTRAGGHVFVTLTTLQTGKTPPAEDGSDLPASLDIIRSLVQIDAPRTPGEVRWNARMAAWLKDGEAYAFPEDGRITFDAPGSIDIGIGIAAASAAVISATLTNSYNWGGPHPNSSSESIIWSLPLGRALSNREILDVTAPPLGLSAWLRFEAGSQSGCEQPDLAKSKLQLTDTGVSFTFDPYELGGYLCGGGTHLTWTEIAPYLRQPLPFRPADMQAPRP